MTVSAGKPESAGYGRIGIEEEEEEDKAVVKGSVKLFTMDEVARHNTLKDIWIIINNKVYDTTDYLDLHPGGVNSILINGGADATEDFFSIHSSKANKMLEKFYLGDLDVSSIKKSEAIEDVARLEDDGLVDDSHGSTAEMEPLSPERAIDQHYLFDEPYGTKPVEFTCCGGQRQEEKKNDNCIIA